MSLLPWNGCPMCGAPNKMLCNCPPCDVIPHFSRKDLDNPAVTGTAAPECGTCNGDPAVCAAVPGLRHCEAAKPQETPPWSGETYRDKKGKWPSDITEHCDWLSKIDY